MEVQTLVTTASIIICTANKPQSLSDTLESLKSVIVPATIFLDVVIVDNQPSSSKEVARRAHSDQLPIRYLEEPRRGKSIGLNTAISATESEILIFTDDDLRFNSDWVEQLTRPLREGTADAVAGDIRIAPHLRRSWMKRLHRIYFAEHPELEQWDGNLIGANMAFHRRILDKVTGFDTSLGPGALGFMDDIVLSWKIRDAGFKMQFVPGASVTHHFDERRLLRKNLLNHGLSDGRSQGYVAFHYEPKMKASARLARCYAQLAFSRSTRREPTAEEEGCEVSELTHNIAKGFIEQYKKEMKDSGDSLRSF